MRCMIFVKASRDTEAGAAPTEALIARMSAYVEELAKAGVLLDAHGLHPSVRGARIRYDGERRTVIDGPFAETKELVAGYTLIETKSWEEAMEWARRFPNPSVDDGEAEIEIRQILELDEFLEPKDADRFRAVAPETA